MTMVKDSRCSQIDYGTSESGGRFRRWAGSLLVLVAIVVVALLAIDRFLVPAELIPKEVEAFGELSNLAQAMIADGSPGVVRDAGRSRISSFDAFQKYVSNRHPEWVIGQTAANPFPGILPKGDYAWSKQPLDQTDDLLWDKKSHQRPIGLVRLRLDSHGIFHADVATNNR